MAIGYSLVNSREGDKTDATVSDAMQHVRRRARGFQIDSRMYSPTSLPAPGQRMLGAYGDCHHEGKCTLPGRRLCSQQEPQW